MVSSLWFSCGLAVSVGEAACCVAGVALPDILTCLQMCRKSFRVAGAILSRRFQERVAFFAAGVVLWRPPSSFFVALADLYTLRSTLHRLHSTPHTVDFTLCTLRSTLYTVHFTLHTLETCWSLKTSIWFQTSSTFDIL